MFPWTHHLFHTFFISFFFNVLKVSSPIILPSYGPGSCGLENDCVATSSYLNVVTDGQLVIKITVMVVWGNLGTIFSRGYFWGETEKRIEQT
jgi:hypothetical protein